jgi:hypothetical protein
MELCKYNIVKKNFLRVILWYNAAARQKGRVDEEEDVSSFWMTLRKVENDGT